MCRDRLGVFDCSAVFQVGRDTRCSEGVTTGGVGETGSECSPFYHAQHVSPRHRIERHFFVSINAPEEGTLLFFPDTGNDEYGLLVVGGLADLVGPTALYSPSQVKRGLFETDIQAIERNQPGALPRLSNNGRAQHRS